MNSETSTLQLNQEKRQKEPQNNDVRKIVGATGFELSPGAVSSWIEAHPKRWGHERTQFGRLGKEAMANARDAIIKSIA
jgi:hypothetical protein